jgi:hypothetical protein
VTILAADTSAQHTQTIVTIIVGVLTILTVVLAAGRWTVRRYLEPNRRMVDEWTGDPGQPAKGIPPRLGALERITTLERSMGTVTGAVTKNGGSSMLDAVNRIEANTGKPGGLL